MSDDNLYNEQFKYALIDLYIKGLISRKSLCEEFGLHYDIAEIEHIDEMIEEKEEDNPFGMIIVE